MKIGSLVECIIPVKNDMYAKDIDKGVIYTIRGFHKYDPGVYLEEVINPVNIFTSNEFAYRIDRFRELLPPIANIEEHINENTLEPELI